MEKRNLLLHEKKHYEAIMAMERIEILSRTYREIVDVLVDTMTSEVCEFGLIEAAYGLLGDSFVAAAKADARYLLKDVFASFENAEVVLAELDVADIQNIIHELENELEKRIKKRGSEKAASIEKQL